MSYFCVKLTWTLDNMHALGKIRNIPIKKRIWSRGTAQPDCAAQLVLVDGSDHGEREEAAIIIRAVRLSMKARVQGPAGAVVAVTKEVSHAGAANKAIATTPSISNPRDVHSQVNNTETMSRS